jgi:beta-RFAP synthase
MVEPPAVEVTIEPAVKFTVSGALAQRAERFAMSAGREWQLPAPPACHIHVQSPPEHTGMGVGSLLGLSIAAGLRRFLELPELTAEALAASVGRGRRSAVGTHGFLLGGLIVDAGKEPGQSLGTLFERVAVPDDWRFVLISSIGQPGLTGDSEADAFSRLPPVPGEVTQELWRLTEAEMLPAVKRADCAAFGEAVYHFGRFAGECFAAVQAGRLQREIGRLRRDPRPRDGVGQSSWGPTVFAVTPNDAEAHALTEWLHGNLGVPLGEITIARPNHQGAAIT